MATYHRCASVCVWVGTVVSVLVVTSLPPGARAAIVTSGQVSPAWNGTDPWNTGSTLAIAFTGTGSMTVTNGSHVNSPNSTLGTSLNSVGTATVNNAFWQTSTLTVGGTGQGIINDLNGASVSSSSTITIGLNDSAVQSSIVVDNSAQLTATGAMTIGSAGKGLLKLDHGGTASNTSATLGSAATGVGDAQILNGIWTNTGILTVGGSGHGSLTIGSAGHVTNTEADIALNANSVGVVTVDGGTWTNSGFLIVGKAGAGELYIHSGSTVNSSTSSYLGFQSMSSGLVEVDGGVWHTNIILEIGQSGSGTLHISNGGVVTDDDGYLGDSGSSSGTATVENGTWTNNGYLIVGSNGVGFLDIGAGGHVSSGAFADIGGGGIGSVTVEGNDARLDVAMDLTLGQTGTSKGTMVIKDGGVVTDQRGFVAFGTNTNAAVSIIGDGSKWINLGDVGVGDDTGQN